MADTRYLTLNRDRANLIARERRWRCRLKFLTPVAVLLVVAATVVLGVAGGIIAGVLALFVLRPPVISGILASGLQGEEAVLDRLLGLPDDYILFNQVFVPNPGSRTGTTEIDLAVVGPTGLFTIEVKNNKGTIRGGPERARTWKVEKVGKNGGLYTSEMRNPVRQAKFQADALHGWLKDQGIRVWVQPMVVLSNPEAKWIPTEHYFVPVVGPGKSMLPVIAPYGVNPITPNLDADQIHQIVEALRTLERGSGIDYDETASFFGRMRSSVQLKKTQPGGTSSPSWQYLSAPAALRKAGDRPVCHTGTNPPAPSGRSALRFRARLAPNSRSGDRLRGPRAHRQSLKGHR